MTIRQSFIQPRGCPKAIKKCRFGSVFLTGMQQGNEDVGKRLDQIILEKRLERGLPSFPDPDDL